MTKFEWERQLKKGISGLPKAEQQRVLDYYNELFADKIDAGLREQYIISEFGNPYDVANKILVDFYNDGKENPEVDEYIYADSDDIDVAFDDEQEPQTVQHPTRDSVSERRAERREKHFEQTSKHNDDAPVSKSTKQKARGAGGLITMLCVLLYCILGAFFDLWHPGWLIFLLMPCAITLVEAIIKRNYRIFAYPVFVTCLFLCLGFFTGLWHPAWILFITIPAYYVLGDFICKNVNKNNKSQQAEQAQEKKPKQEEPFEETSAKPERPKYATEVKATTKRGRSRSVFSTIVKVLLALCLIGVAIGMWWCVIGLFIGGIGMIIGGIACIASAFFTGAAVDMVLLGAGIAVLGLGLIATFGMSMLFKPCFNACKTFVRTIKNTFNDKENA